jgi:hypothetical protein
LRRTVEPTGVKTREELDADRHDEHDQEAKYLDLTMDLHQRRRAGRQRPAERKAEQQIQAKREPGPDAERETGANQ